MQLGRRPAISEQRRAATASSTRRAAIARAQSATQRSDDAVDQHRRHDDAHARPQHASRRHRRSRAVNEITTIQKYGRMIGTETISRNASNADCRRRAATAGACGRARPNRAAHARRLPGCADAVAASMHLDPRRLQQPPHVHQPPHRERRDHADRRSGSATAPRHTRTGRSRTRADRRRARTPSCRRTGRRR